MDRVPREGMQPSAAFRQMAKIDLHRHLEGSLRLSTLREIAREYAIPLPDGTLAAQVQVQPSDPLTAANFLSKFLVLRQFYRTPEMIARVTAEAVADAAADGIVYLELRFTPAALARQQGFALAEVMDWVAAAAAEAAAAEAAAAESAETEAAGRRPITVRLIASVNRHEPVELAEKVAALAAQRMDRGVVGLDLAGNEADYPMLPFAGVFREARESGLRITVHAGEWGGPENVRQAILDLQAERIGHGDRVLEDAWVTALARERGAALEVCLTSNYQSGVVPALRAHPLPRLIDAGLKVTLNSDDPSISGITLSDEYRVACGELGLSAEALGACIRNAARSAFLPPEQSRALEARLG